MPFLWCDLEPLPDHPAPPLVPGPVVPDVRDGSAMTCARGCCETQREHYLSLRVAAPDRSALTKTTTDDHGTHSVDVTDHYNDRRDVLIKPKTVRYRLSKTEE